MVHEREKRESNNTRSNEGEELKNHRDGKKNKPLGSIGCPASPNLAFHKVKDDSKGP